MDRRPFEPADGVKSHKDRCYELVLGLEPGAQIPAHEVMELCDCDRSGAFAAMRDAALALERDGYQSVETRPGYGWVVIDRGKAMLNKAKVRNRRRLRAADKTATTTMNVDRDRLGQFERQDHDVLVGNLARAAELRGRKARSLTEIARQAKQLPQQDPRVRELPRQRREDAG